MRHSHSRHHSRDITPQHIVFTITPLIAKPGTLLKPQSPRLRHRRLGIYESCAPHPKPPPPRDDDSPPTARRRRPPTSPFDFTPVRIAAERGIYVKRQCDVCRLPLSFRALCALSCGHVCHCECAGGRRHCPVCARRCDALEVPRRAYEAHAARLIQRIARGFLVRSQLGRISPPGSMLHRNWVLGRAQTASTMLADAIESQSDVVDAILASIDRELDWARAVMSAVDVHERVVDWAEIEQRIARRGMGRGRGVCSICLGEMGSGECVVTSCEHCFHGACLNSWMEFCHRDDTTASCPVCRSPFQYKAL